MNFLRLFAAGKGLIGMRNSTSPYRMKRGAGLPKFGSPKNPFAPPPFTEPLNASPCKPEAEKESAVGRETAVMETERLFKAATPEPVAKPQEPAPVRAAKSAKSNLPPIQPAQPELRPAAPASSKPEPKRTPAGAWLKKVKKLNPLALLPTRQKSGSVARSHALRPAVQGELSLDKVKVVRNDLSDTDLEIVPARNAMKTQSGQPAAGAVMALDEETAWNRLTARFFRAEETQVR